MFGPSSSFCCNREVLSSPQSAPELHSSSLLLRSRGSTMLAAPFHRPLLEKGLMAPRGSRHLPHGRSSPPQALLTHSSLR